MIDVDRDWGTKSLESGSDYFAVQFCRGNEESFGIPKQQNNQIVNDAAPAYERPIEDVLVAYSTLPGSPTRSYWVIAGFFGSSSHLY